MYTINQKSWHFRFAEMFGGWRAHDVTNLCPYVRMVLKGMALFTFFAALAVGLAFLNLLGIMDAVNGFWLTNGELSVFATFNVATLALILIPLAFYVTDELRQRYDAYKYKQYIAKRSEIEAPDYVPPQPSFIALWWKSVHDKMCPGIEIK